MSFKISPIGNFVQFVNSDGKPLSGGKIFTYISGSFSIKSPTWTDITGTVENSNPIVLNPSGRSPTAIWLDTELQYQFVLTKPDGTTVIASTDNVGSATEGGGGGTFVPTATVTEWGGNWPMSPFNDVYPAIVTGTQFDSIYAKHITNGSGAHVIQMQVDGYFEVKYDFVMNGAVSTPIWIELDYINGKLTNVGYSPDVQGYHFEASKIWRFAANNEFQPVLHLSTPAGIDMDQGSVELTTIVTYLGP